MSVAAVLAAADRSPYTVVVYPVGDLVSAAEGKAAQRQSDRLAALIQAVVRPDSWTDPRALIAERPAGSLTVAQTAAGHGALQDLLAALRTQRQTRIRIQTRLFTYSTPETQALVTKAMGLGRSGPARVVLAEAEATRLADALAHRPDVEADTAPVITFVSGAQVQVSLGQETPLSTRWRNDPSESGPPIRPVELSAFEGKALVMSAAAAADRRSVVLQVHGAATLLAGDRPVWDGLGRIDLPEFAASRVSASARVPSGHTLLVGGLRTRAEASRGAAPAGRWGGRRDAVVLLLVTPTVIAPAGAPQPPAEAAAKPEADLEAMAIAAHLRRWAPPGLRRPVEPAGPPPRVAVAIASADGLVTLDLNLAESDLRTPGVQEWLRRLLRKEAADPSMPPKTRPSASGAPPALAAADECVLSTYDARDLLAVGMRFPATPLGVSDEVGPRSARGFSVLRGGGAGEALTRPAAPSWGGTDQAMETELERLVREAAGEAAWAPAGPGRLAVHDGLLAVWQRPAIQGRIAAWLDRVRLRARAQVVIRAGVYLLSDAATDRVHRTLKVNDLKPASPLVPTDAPPVKGALLAPDQVEAAVRLMNTMPGARPLMGGTVSCLPVHEATLEDVEQLVFVSRLERPEGAAEASPRPGVATSGSVLRLHPVPSADFERLQLGVSVGVGHLDRIDTADGSVIGPPGGAVHRPDVRTTSLDMTVVVPAGQGVLVGGPKVTAGDEWGRAVSGQLMCLFWPTMEPGDEAPSGRSAADGWSALRTALDRPLRVSLANARLAEALETLRRTGVPIEVQVVGDEAARQALLDRRVTFPQRETSLGEALGTLVGDRLERVELLPPAGIRLHLSAAEGAVTRPATDDQPVGTLTVRSPDGRTVTRFEVRRRDLTAEVRALIEERLSETLRQ